ncbi:MAG: polyphosphate polymerase domain-containing protein [Oscillospiraceae bacterium]|jgi:hypothetical protein|nr:polyphosphate polymerase domain-containing protein [Oscillospiraceae bacterium]
MEYRNEQKFFMSANTAHILRRRVSAVMRPDIHSGGAYVVNNLYLDDQYDSFLHDKLSGSFSRVKYRIRFYNGDLSFIRLERKRKDGDLSFKESAVITEDEYRLFARGDLDFAVSSPHPLLQKVAVLHRLRRLRPTAAFSYTREAYIYGPGNVRVTFDSALRPDGPARPANRGDPPGAGGMLEVKFDRFLPDVIGGLLHGTPLARTEMSKYYCARERKI